MAITSSFSNMLNEFVNEDLLYNEMKKKNWFMANLPTEKNWLGGAYKIPFVGAVGTSVAFGAYTDAADISEETTVRGSVDFAEMTSSMIFNNKDISQHGTVSEQNFLKMLPDAIMRHTKFVDRLVSTSMLGGGYISAVTADGTSGGLITVDDPERFQLKQKVFVDDGDSSPSAAGYIRAINSNTGVLTIFDAITGGSVINLSTYTVAQAAKIYAPGQQVSGFASLRGILLPSTDGGDASYAGVTKTDYQHTQAISSSGSDITATNILTKLFDFLTLVRKRGQGNPTKCVMSWKNYASCLKSLESSKGAFNVRPGAASAEVFPWDSTTIGGFAGSMELVAVHEASNAEIVLLDLDSMKFASNGGFKRVKTPEGLEYFTVRATTGHSYIVDHCMQGNLIVKAPANNGILHSISY